MSDPTPLPTDAAASLADKTITQVLDVAETTAETAADTAIIAAAPVMATPVLRQFWEGLLNGLLGWIFTLLKGALGLLGGYVVMEEQKYLDLTNAASALQTLTTAQKSGDPNALAQANTNADAALAPVLQFIGTIKP